MSYGCHVLQGTRSLVISMSDPNVEGIVATKAIHGYRRLDLLEPKWHQASNYDIG